MGGRSDGEQCTTLHQPVTTMMILLKKRKREKKKGEMNRLCSPRVFDKRDQSSQYRSLKVSNNTSRGESGVAAEGVSNAPIRAEIKRKGKGIVCLNNKQDESECIMLFEKTKAPRGWRLPGGVKTHQRKWLR